MTGAALGAKESFDSSDGGDDDDDDELIGLLIS